MFILENEEFSPYDFLLNTCDWISCTNEGVSFEEFLILLDSNGIKFSIRRSFEHQFVVIDKSSYVEFFALLPSTPSVRITRIDLRFDTFQDFKAMYEPYLEDWRPSSCVGKLGRYETIYFGSRSSDLYCRFYDKQKESNLNFPCSRLEFEVKGFLCKQFSLRISYISLDDALSFLLDNIRDFMYKQKLDGLVNIPTYGKYIPFDIVNHASMVDKFRRFVKQYSSSILSYLDSFDLNGNEFVELLEDKSKLNEFLENEVGI